MRELGFTPELSAELDVEHQKMVVALDGADSAMAAFASNPTTDTAQTACAAGQLMELIVAAEKVISHVQALQLTAVADGGRRWP